MDIYSFTKRVDNLEHETFFHFRWNGDHYEAHVFLYNRLYLFEMVQADGKWEFVDEDTIPIPVFAVDKELAGACAEHYHWMKAQLKS